MVMFVSPSFFLGTATGCGQRATNTGSRPGFKSPILLSIFSCWMVTSLGSHVCKVKVWRWKEPGSPKPLHMPGPLHLHQVVTCVRKTSFISLILECLNISAWQSFGRKSFGM